jgi:heme A synthase
MTQWHATLGIAVAGVALLFVLVAAVTAWLDRGGHAQIMRLRLGVQALLAVQVVLGGLLYLTGARPGEVLHLVYGIAILGVLPLATTFASDAPPRARSWVLAVAGLLILLLAWRLLSTG